MFPSSKPNETRDKLLIEAYKIQSWVGGLQKTQKEIDGLERIKKKFIN